jgi:hypothetical protein
MKVVDDREAAGGPSREEFDALTRRLEYAEKMVVVLQLNLIELYCRVGQPYPKNWPARE